MGNSMAERAASTPAAGEPATGAISPRAAALHDDALVWDMVFVREPDHGNDARPSVTASSPSACTWRDSAAWSATST